MIFVRNIKMIIVIFKDMKFHIKRITRIVNFLGSEQKDKKTQKMFSYNFLHTKKYPLNRLYFLYSLFCSEELAQAKSLIKCIL